MKYLVLSILLLAVLFPLSGQTKKTGVTRFKYQMDTRTKIPQPVDTALTGSQYHRQLYNIPGSWSELGNTGLPAINNQYRPIREALNPLMFEGTDGYTREDNSLTIFSANSPFSLLNYNSGGTSDKNGQTIRAIFGRNLKRKGNITALGSYDNSEGHFSKQNCNSSSVNINYILTRDNYSLVTGFSRNSFKFSENGGLRSDDELSSAYLPNLIPVNLSGALAEMSIMTWKGVQAGTLGFKGRKSRNGNPADSTAQDSLAEIPPGKRSPLIVHNFKVSNFSRKYSDSPADAGFYQNTYSEDLSTNDSIGFLSWTNTISVLSDTIRIGTQPILLSGGLNPDFFRYQRADSVSMGFSLGLNGKISRQVGNSTLQLSGKWFAAGYAAGDYGLNAWYKIVPGTKTGGAEFTIELFARGCSPDPIIQSFTSNHFRWINDFSRQRESGLNARIDLPALKASFSAGMVRNVNRIYFDTTGMPAQHRSGMSVLSVQGSKEFRAGPLRSNWSGLLQYSTSDVIRLPLYVASTSTFMHHDIKFPSTDGELQVEYGFDLSYSAGFFGYAYMPATGIFYGQDEKELGNYPYLNVFGQIKVKRTRIFVQWCHTFADMLPEQSFAVLHYPSMRPHLKYGIYWHFYD